MKSLSEEVVDVLKQERHRQGLSRKEIAERAGFTLSFVGQIERNEGDRAVSVFGRYAAALNKRVEVSLAEAA